MRKPVLHLAFILFAGVILSSCMQNNPPASTAADQAVSTEDLIARGEYLVHTIGCHDCHSPKRMGAHGPEIISELHLSGYPGDRPIAKVNNEVIKIGWGMFNEDLTTFAGPWGQSFAANITSDPTGIGNWSEDQFRKAMTQGKFKGIDGGRMLLPPMPWQNWTNIKDEDLKAIFAYLKSTPPVNNVVPAPISLEDLLAGK